MLNRGAARRADAFPIGPHAVLLAASAAGARPLSWACSISAGHIEILLLWNDMIWNRSKNSLDWLVESRKILASTMLYYQ